MDKILVVEDDKKTREWLRKSLEYSGYGVELSADGEAGVSSLERRALPDLILLDMHMPGMDGNAFLEKIKSHEEWSQIPVIILSGISDYQAAASLIKKGASDFLLKPAEPVFLENKIKMVLDKRRVEEHNTLLLKEAVEQKELLEHTVADKVRLERMLIHDIKTPLSSLLLALEMSLEAKKENFLPLAREAFGSGRLIQHLVEELSDLIRGGSPKLGVHPKPFSFFELVEECFNVMEVQAEDMELELVNLVDEGNSLIKADYSAIRRSVMNLISNAIDYAPEGTRVEVSFKCANHWVAIHVTDEGPGIPEDDHELVLQPFKQSVKYKKRSGKEGTGLGLSFCRMAAETHGGFVLIQTNGEMGADISMVLPRDL